MVSKNLFKIGSVLLFYQTQHVNCTPTADSVGVVGMRKDKKRKASFKRQQLDKTRQFFVVGGMVIILFLCVEKNIFRNQSDEEIFQSLIKKAQSLSECKIRGIATKARKEKLKEILLKGDVENPKKRSYSYGIKSVKEGLDISLDLDLITIGRALSEEGGDKINIFKFDGTIFIGFESRKQAYDEDCKEDKNFIFKQMTQEQKRAKPIFSLQI